jgi:DNA-binding SARP family transcriptional activator
MSSLRIELFGAPRLSCDAERLPQFPTQRAMSLFAYLVVHRGRLHARDTLAGTFCGDSIDSVARKYLRTDLWRIRDTLRKAGADAERFLVVQQHLVGFDSAGDYWLDLEEFERRLADAARVARNSPTEACRYLEEAVELYRGRLVQGLYDDWCFGEQERCHALYLGALEHVMTCLVQQGDLRRALVFGQRLLADDPLRESLHREVMRLLYRLGDRPAALRQFSKCVETLRRDLDVSPMAETIRLYRSILEEAPLAGDASAPRSPVPGTPVRAGALPGDLLGLADALRLAQTHIGSALARIDEGQRSSPVPPVSRR